MNSPKSYITGLVLAIVLTLAAFYPVYLHVHSHHLAISHEFIRWWVLTLAVIQILVQLKFFLHISPKTNSGLDVGIFWTTVSIILIVVIGSIWIMNHLNYNMTPQQMDDYMIKSEGMFK